MSTLEVTGASLEFSVRQTKSATLKEYVLKGLFRRSLNPEMTIHALSEINLSARAGDRIGIIGHNGAGKTTLLKLLAGIYPPTRGTCVVQGQICSLFDITLGFEQDATGWENISYRSYLQGDNPTSLRAKIDDVGAFSELGEFLSLPVKNYSAGMRMRLAFAIATAANPEILLVDEVLAVGDMAFQIKARARMRELISASQLLVIVSHDMNTIKETCNRVLWMKQGKVVQDGPTAEVIRAYAVEVHAQSKAAKEAPKSPSAAA